MAVLRIIPDEVSVAVDGVSRYVNVQGLNNAFEKANDGWLHAIHFDTKLGTGTVEWRKPPRGRDVVTKLTSADFNPAPYVAAWTLAAHLWAIFQRSDGRLTEFYDGPYEPPTVASSIAVPVAERFHPRQKRWDGATGIRDATIVEARRVDKQLKESR